MWQFRIRALCIFLNFVMAENNSLKAQMESLTKQLEETQQGLADMKQEMAELRLAHQLGDLVRASIAVVRTLVPGGTNASDDDLLAHGRLQGLKVATEFNSNSDVLDWMKARMNDSANHHPWSPSWKVKFPLKVTKAQALLAINRLPDPDERLYATMVLDFLGNNNGLQP